VGSLSAPTALAYLVPFIHRIPFIFVWDTILFILWIALFGIFGKMYIHENPEGNGGIKRMKSAVWMDLVNALLWLISAIGMAGYWWKARNGTRTKWTGRARV
jgi:H+/Cl- antiporter ClcA